jgi:microcystin-dependent protein
MKNKSLIFFLTCGCLLIFVGFLATSCDLNLAGGGGGGGAGAEVETLEIRYIICINGAYPSRDGDNSADAMIGEIKMFAGNFAPGGWALCEGQLLAIDQNAALFSILGTTYGGDGRTTFALPDLSGRVPVHP